MPNLQEYISRLAFERACRQYLWQAFAAGKLPSELAFTDVGTWWGAGDKQIDVDAVDAEERVILAGSCKWTNAPVDDPEYVALLTDLKSVATHLQLDANAIGTADGPWLAIFSRAGFTPRLEEIAARQQPQRLMLVSIETLYTV